MASDEIAVQGFPGSMVRGNRRQLAGSISAAGDSVVTVHGAKITKREAVSHLVWNALVYGEIYFADGRVIQLDDVDQWLAVLKWVGAHVDGPPVTFSDSQNVNAVVRVVYGDEPAYPEGQEPIAGGKIYEQYEAT
jgi:hypothetical protein